MFGTIRDLQRLNEMLKDENQKLKQLADKKQKMVETNNHNCNVLCIGCEHYIDTLHEHGCALDRECKDYSKKGGN